MKYAIRWKTTAWERWYIRGIRPDGYFYGTVDNFARGYGFSFEGSVLEWPAALATLESLASPSEPQKIGPTGTEVLPSGLVARYEKTLGEAQIIYHYESGDESMNLQARKFLDLIKFLEPTIRACDPYPLGTEVIPRP